MCKQAVEAGGWEAGGCSLLSLLSLEKHFCLSCIVSSLSSHALLAEEEELLSPPLALCLPAYLHGCCGTGLPHLSLLSACLSLFLTPLSLSHTWEDMHSPLPASRSKPSTVGEEEEDGRSDIFFLAHVSFILHIFYTYV